MTITTISSLLEGTDSYKQRILDIEKKHFDIDNGAGSLFTEVKNVKELLELCLSQRGSLDGDDRKVFVEKGIPLDALKKDCRYLYVKTKGMLRVVCADELPIDTKVYVIQMKNNIYHDGIIKVIPASLCVIDKRRSISYEATIIISNETKEIVTVFAGLPTVPQDRYWTTGDNITVEDVIKKLGSKKYLNIIAEENVINILSKTSYKIPNKYLKRK